MGLVLSAAIALKYLITSLSKVKLDLNIIINIIQI